MRNARINTIGEGANEVLKAFIALVGMRDIGEGLKSTLEGLQETRHVFADALEFQSRPSGAIVHSPVVPVVSPMLRPIAAGLSRRVSRFGRTVEWLLVTHREAFFDRQYDQERIADAAIALVTSACTLSRWDHSLVQGAATGPDELAADLYMHMAFRRFDDSLRQLGHNDDSLTTKTALAALSKWAGYEPPT